MTNVENEGNSILPPVENDKNIVSWKQSIRIINAENCFQTKGVFNMIVLSQISAIMNLSTLQEI